MKRTIIGAAGLATALSVFALVAPNTAQAARQAVCEHPEGSQCTAVRDTGRISCQCLDGEHELQDPTLPMTDESGLMDACWEAWTQTCAPWKAEWVECEEPDAGACEVTADEGGKVACACADGNEVEEPLASLEDQDADALEDSCYEQIDRLCGPPEPEPVASQPTVVSPTEPEVTCAVDPNGRTPGLLLGLLGLLGLGSARRRRRS